MYFITGGAFNGKIEWTKNNLVYTQNVKWVKEEESIFPLGGEDNSTIVITNLEKRIYCMLDQVDSSKIRIIWVQMLLDLKNWELHGNNRHVLIIGNDITRGIVPMDASIRQFRDLVGWLYQDTVKYCDDVYKIWYGLPTKLK
ncbi:hypothetical protein Q73_07090 [Bacillus coahuilensis m2-6]|uniref:bifunctional adenosylcobinamide kinase/adenosylcobinamide-phosphate guanylyltransferase n=1 Tax=Bacillus coahuilensis TaxID=408580 RepID=UPI0007502732|nr:bifunctional adenosylcobinamide kinase/adenosylcobinamide-phosphate guanylyltransferase [Bacillus coahuilensis]KUP08125.1 hypothetical protein Q73_07090 [Bacillus coahuilensis m2-6]